LHRSDELCADDHQRIFCAREALLDLVRELGTEADRLVVVEHLQTSGSQRFRQLPDERRILVHDMTDTDIMHESRIGL
jgi:hypothetical protein